MIRTWSTAAVVGFLGVAMLGASALTGCSGLGPHDPEPGADGDLPVLTGTTGDRLTLATPETELLFGAEAVVVTTDKDDRLLAWSVTVDAPTDLSPDRLVTEEDPDEFTEDVRCFRTALTFLGGTTKDSVGHPYSADREELTLASVRDAGMVETAPPTMGPTLGDGHDAEGVEADADDSCSVPDNDRLPHVEGDLVTGKTYTRALLGAGPGATSVRFDYPTGLPGVSGDESAPSSVYWGPAKEEQ